MNISNTKSVKSNGFKYIILLSILFAFNIFILYIEKDLLLPIYIYACLSIMLVFIIYVGIALRKKDLSNPFFKYDKKKYWMIISSVALVYMWLSLALFLFCDLNETKDYVFSLMPKAMLLSAILICLSSAVYIVIIEMLYKISIGKKENNKIEPFYLFFAAAIIINFILFIILRNTYIGYHSIMKSGTRVRDWAFYFFAGGGASLTVLIMTIQYKAKFILFKSLENLITISNKKGTAEIKKMLFNNISNG